MFIAYSVVASLYALLLLMSTAGKLKGDPATVATLSSVGVERQHIPWLAAAEAAAAIGLVAGIFWAPIGIAAAAGITLYFMGAVGAHVRAKDPKYAPAAVFVVVSIVTLTLAILAV